MGNELGICGSRDTILRLVRHHPLPSVPAPRIIGLDDWSWKRRLRYGTLICDLERSIPIDVLPDRSVETVAAWLAAHPTVELFLHMVRERAGEQLDTWLEAVQASQLEAFASFVTSIQQDQNAVLAGLTLPWSTGPLEGHINRLKLIKRQGYGRAKFDLLRLRVLHYHHKSK